MANKKSIWRWVGEAVLVFASVLGAFMVEDYRHNKQEKEDYINTLLAFRNDVDGLIGDFRGSYDTVYNSTGILLYQQKLVADVLSMINDNERANDIEALALFKNKLMWWAQWRGVSGYYNSLNNYSELVLQDSLMGVLQRYRHILLTEFKPYEDWNFKRSKFLEWYDQNYDHNEDNINLRIAGSNYFKNVVMYYKRTIELLLWGENNHAIWLSIDLKEIDKALINHGINEAILESKYATYEKKFSIP